MPERLRERAENHLGPTEDALRSAAAEIERLREDKERLDWLEENIHEALNEDTDGNRWQSWEVHADVDFIGTLREAIDAARGGDDV